ncbi:unnamed protein product [Psylliodes chrysocephalus]|uniref:Uncharacterized protein n=1 Tax=Psylliodes chrysocephalus TaxID=3402493 RepID=A0A9P0D431_9CUCU|nr:unnamed protein product [Psylliodes chrysocephala]
MSDTSISSEEEPFVDSGSEYVPSNPDIPGPSRIRKRLFPAKTQNRRNTAANEQGIAQENTAANEQSIAQDNVLKFKKGKKRVKNPSFWKRNNIKRKKAKREEYINWAKQKVPKKTTGPNCNCKMKCFTKISDPKKQSILKQFYDIGDKNRQDTYLGGLITVLGVQRKRPTTGEGKEKTVFYQYKKCDHLTNIIAAENDAERKVILEGDKRLHIQKAEVFYKKLKEATELAKGGGVDVLCFDYQQNLPLPHIPSGDVFYKRQLWEYNFCIHSSITKLATFYMYDEMTAKKGCNEVVSFLHHYITNYVSEDVTTLYLFSNNCFAQNKNHTLIQYLHTFMNISGSRIRQIIHQFPEPGHSFLPFDRCFGLIEKEKRKKEIVYLAYDWINLVKKT